MVKDQTLVCGRRWGAWWMPVSGLAGKGGVDLIITLKDGNSMSTTDYPLADASQWRTGAIYNIFRNVPAAC